MSFQEVKSLEGGVTFRTEGVRWKCLEEMYLCFPPPALDIRRSENSPDNLVRHASAGRLRVKSRLARMFT